MQTIRLTDGDLMPEADRLEGDYLDARHHDRVVRDTCTVLKPDGSPLLIYVADVLPRPACLRAFDAFRDVPLRSDNRGVASGMPRFRPVRRNGKVSRRLQARPVNSGVIGFLDRTRQLPYCRTTALTMDHPGALRGARPLAAAASDLFRELAPDRWAAQRAFVEGVDPAFVIPGTVFTTITVNRSWRTAAHTDAGDYRPGMGVMAVLEGGRFGGGELIFPRYRTAVDMRTGGLCLADVHELHGNAPMWGQRFTRLSFVFYARERMRNCGTPEEEREQAALLLS